MGCTGSPPIADTHQVLTSAKKGNSMNPKPPGYIEIDPAKDSLKMFRLRPEVSDKEFTDAVAEWLKANHWPMKVTVNDRYHFAPGLDEVDGTISVLLQRNVSKTAIRKELGVGVSRIQRVADLLKEGES